MKRFEEKVAIVTGAASGIGEATVRRLVAEGAKVVIADYNKERADKLAEELTRQEADVQPVFFSAGDLESCSRLIDFASSNYERIDILVNNVGGSNLKLDKNIETLDIHYFDEVFHLNVRCAVYLTQLVIPLMKSQGGGNIVNIASIIKNIFLKHNSLPYLGEPDNIASVIAFLASEDAKYITGQTLVADGGLTIHNPTVAEMNDLSSAVRT